MKEKKEMDKKLKVSAGTFVSLVLMILGIINLVLQALGKPSIQFGTQEVTIFVTALYTFVAGIYAWWKNNNVTKNALTVQVIFNGLKDGLVNAQELLDAYEALVKSKKDATAQESKIESEQPLSEKDETEG